MLILVFIVLPVALIVVARRRRRRRRRRGRGGDERQLSLDTVDGGEDSLRAALAELTSLDKVGDPRTQFGELCRDLVGLPLPGELSYLRHPRSKFGGGRVADVGAVAPAPAYEHARDDDGDDESLHGVTDSSSWVTASSNGAGSGGVGRRHRRGLGRGKVRAVADCNDQPDRHQNSGGG